MRKVKRGSERPSHEGTEREGERGREMRGKGANENVGEGGKRESAARVKEIHQEVEERARRK